MEAGSILMKPHHAWCVKVVAVIQMARSFDMHNMKSCKIICDGCGNRLGQLYVGPDGPDEIEASSDGEGDLDYHADRCNNCHPFIGNCRDCGDPMYKGIRVAWAEDDYGEFSWTCC